MTYTTDNTRPTPLTDAELDRRSEEMAALFAQADAIGSRYDEDPSEPDEGTLAQFDEVWHENKRLRKARAIAAAPLAPWAAATTFDGVSID